MAEIVESGRFKYIKVNANCSIRDFAAKHKLEFKPGRGFYQLTKPETIQVGTKKWSVIITISIEAV